jgi:hypothetical protein
VASRKRCAARCGRPRTHGRWCGPCAALRAKFGVEPRDVQRLRKTASCGICGRLGALLVDGRDGRVSGFLCAVCMRGLRAFRTTTRLMLALRYMVRSRPDLRPAVRQAQAPDNPVPRAVLEKYMAAPLPSLRAKARAMAQETGLSQDAALSRLRRARAGGVD